MAFNSAFHIFTAEILFIDYKTGEEIDFGQCLSGIAIKKDYINNVYPLFVLNLYITKSQREYLAFNKFYISLKILRSSPDANLIANGDTESEDVITDKIVTNILLKPFDPSNIFSTIREDVSVEDDERNIGEQKISYTINCIPFEQLKINNSILNDCYADANLNEVCLNLISSVYTGDIYFQESTNNTRYDSLFIPQLNLIPALRYLHENYRIYNNALNIFFDNNKLYLYDILDANKPRDNTFFIEIRNENIDTNDETFRNILIDENENIEKFYNTNLLFSSNKDVRRYDTGEDIVFSSYDENFNIVNRNIKIDDTENIGDDRKVRYIWNNIGDKVFEDSIKNKLYTSVNIRLLNIDYSLFKPNTLYNITGSKNDEFNGTYELSYMEIYLSTQDGITFKDSVNLGLIKI